MHLESQGGKVAVMSTGHVSGGLNLAYEYVIPSFNWMLARSDSINSRLQNLIGFAAALTIGAPVFGKAVREHLVVVDSPWFLSAALIFVAIVVLGIVAARVGTITVMDPGVLNSKTWLNLSDQDFKMQALEWAAKHFEKNSTVINRKADILTHFPQVTPEISPPTRRPDVRRS